MSDETGSMTPAMCRVLGVLIEKSFITPDAYPLSLNAVLTGCNQLTAREPVMRLGEAEVKEALEALIAQRWAAVHHQAGARVLKYEHCVRLRSSLPPPEQAVLALLLLRGAQTPGELRQRCERLHGFADVQAVEAVLAHLGEKYPALASALPRAPGTKETRYVHGLGPVPQPGAPASFPPLPAEPSPGEDALAQRVAVLETALAALRADFDALRGKMPDLDQQGPASRP